MEGRRETMVVMSTLLTTAITESVGLSSYESYLHKSVCLAVRLGFYNRLLCPLAFYL